MSPSSPSRPFRFILPALICFAAAANRLCAAGAAAAAPPPPPINVILWFDTEDYLSPADDDADKRLAELLSERHIRATFKIVGEKARVLERHGRRDVIEALRQHCIGFHGNYHSVHPAPAEYLAECGLLDGIDEFVRREGPGAADVRRILGVPALACYGQPGSSWAAQAIAALPRCGVQVDGVPCYLDSGNHVGFGGVPFWYAGALVVYDMHPNETRMELFAPGGLARGKQDFARIAQRLAQNGGGGRGGGGLISIFYHPCEWVTDGFWDASNFTRGANPPREQWRMPPQRPREQSEAAFARFAAYIDAMRATPGVRFVAARDLPALYPDPLMTRGASPDEVLELARRLARPDLKGLDDETIAGKIFSPADQFEVLTLAVARLIEAPHGDDASPIVPERLLGPDAAPPATMEQPQAGPPVSWPALRDETIDVKDYLRANHRIPARVFIGADPVAPADFLIALAKAFVSFHDSHEPPGTVTLGNGVQLLTAAHVAPESAKLFAGWIIHKRGFRAPKIMDVARLQAWTLKPATLLATGQN